MGATISGRGLYAGLLTAAALSVLPATAYAQGSGERNPFSAFQDLFTGSLNRQQTNAPQQQFQPSSTPAAPAPSSGGSAPKEWSGEDGASGHPLMAASAIRQSAANFSNCIAGFEGDAVRRGIQAENFRRFTAGLTPDLRIMDFVDAQPEFTKAVWDYLDILVTDARLARGKEMLAKHAAIFDQAEKTYGVDRYIIAAIWGIESNYSTQAGDRPVIRSTATLACVGRRQKYFKDEFLAALEILNRGDVKPELLKGSWAGAFGATQFMPTAFKRDAVDFDGDGRRNIVESVPDVIASTSNKFKKSNWQNGQTWGYEVEIPQRFNFLYADRNRPLTMAQWQALGIKRAGGKPFPRLTDQAYLIAPGGAGGPGFLMLPNFRAIMRYNPSEAYALAIGHFADRLRGGTPFVQAWPRDQRVLTRAERLELQQLLASRGFYRGEPDGSLGGKTQEALRSFQASIGAPADGFASSGMLDRLRVR